MYRLLAFLMCVGLLAPGRAYGFAATDVRFEGNEVVYTFGGEVTFRVYLRTEASVQSLQASYRYEGIPETYTSGVERAEDGLLSFTLDARTATIPAFAQVEYWFTVGLEDGTTATSPTYSFEYFDNRFTWQ